MKVSVKINLALLIIISILLPACSGEKGMPSGVRETFDKYISCWNNGQFDDIENIVSDDFVLFESPGYEPRQGIDNFRKYIMNTRLTYPDFRLVVNETVYEKGKIAYIWTVTGTMQATGDNGSSSHTINGKGISILHFSDEKITNEFRSNNNLQWLMQLGYTIEPPASPDQNAAK